MTETAQDVPGDLQEPARSNWQGMIPERVLGSSVASVPQRIMTRPRDDIDEVFSGPAGQLSTAAHHLSMKGV